MRRQQRGATMFAVVFALSILAAGASLIYMDVILAASRQSVQIEQTLRARAAAEGALEKWRAACQRGFAEAALEERAEYRGEWATGEAVGRLENQGWTVVCTGRSGEASAAPALVRLEVRLERVGSSRWAIVSWNEL